ncbi:uncharacterized protein LOC111179602 [Delphinapterus leucas]|uniref:Uncharacterized protein LOC111179602 n=1 Tax=Delphinapterus leucas TaxID=9749 RepID=A0A2Y9NVR5_DELLE|nr:uncharacterized protein LOC111179602 [Delphinapterus leucas]XP_030616945.1 uncharacterized protein LOC111179602 [Delphinapterus leucas]
MDVQLQVRPHAQTHRAWSGFLDASTCPETQPGEQNQLWSWMDLLPRPNSWNRRALRGSPWDEKTVCQGGCRIPLYFYVPDTTSLSPEEASWPEVDRAGISEADVASPHLILQKPPKSQIGWKFLSPVLSRLPAQLTNRDPRPFSANSWRWWPLRANNVPQTPTPASLHCTGLPSRPLCKAPTRPHPHQGQLVTYLWSIKSLFWTVASPAPLTIDRGSETTRDPSLMLHIADASGSSFQALARAFTPWDDDDEVLGLIPKVSIMTIVIKAASESRGENRFWSQTAWAQILAPPLTDYGKLEVT